ncbi:vasoactive intestinal polypeptide receptor 1b isoform X4 [Entelurus aequoreus]|nr:vasoactive intestinal polypeptide receptor 1b isoform X4 [Entelurus aequoreus]XP_061876671.1 vasoactive intestinal polypeptide receptor 1b isoform X4 [Entelurus aequoreus]XP_061876672.1 vasoactive intestinal polypeptide receptor 1b isoform X4 [Entelurus aequoreus]XP_061876673.1 vasoactive intestinal polypeptide receptor 1b isoform X4 [Entelurus aequoreus]
MCDVMNDIELERQRCENSTSENVTSGCGGEWDMVACWPSAQVGQVVTITCPAYFSYFSEQHKAGNLSKTCTADGWTEMRPLDIALNCGYNINSTSDEGKFFWQVKIGYTVGHSVSLVSLTTAIAVLCIFRKLHCTRNYIHMHLFVSFVLKAIAVLIKDVVLYEVGEVDNCTSSSVGCKVAMVFFQYAIMASFFWLLVEGLYLHALLAVSFFSERKYFWAYILIGWGGPAVFIAAWSVAKTYYNDVGCWDIIETSDVFWWIIKAPILASILMNFILFICIIRILRQKINCPDIGRNESNQYSRLAKSTLLLIPLFGINFIVFAFIPEQVKTQIRLVFDLILGSFQGFVVAVLYCFLNAEVQGELRRKWRRWHLQRHVTADSKSQQPSSNFSTQISLLTRCSPKSRRASSANHQHMSRL